jgi:hypothetical protein
MPRHSVFRSSLCTVYVHVYSVRLVHELGQIVALKKSINLNNAQSRENLINPYDSHPSPNYTPFFHLILIQEYPLHAKLQTSVEYLQIDQSSRHHLRASTTAAASSGESILQTTFLSRFLILSPVFFLVHLLLHIITQNQTKSIRKCKTKGFWKNHQTSKHVGRQ